MTTNARNDFGNPVLSHLLAEVITASRKVPMTRQEALDILKRNNVSTLEALEVIKATNPLRPMSIAESEIKRAAESVEGATTARVALGGSEPQSGPPSSTADISSTPPRPQDVTASDFAEEIWQSLAEDAGR